MFVRVTVDRDRLRELAGELNRQARAMRPRTAAYVRRGSPRSAGRVVLDASCGVDGVWHIPGIS